MGHEYIGHTCVGAANLFFRTSTRPHLCKAITISGHNCVGAANLFSHFYKATPMQGHNYIRPYLYRRSLCFPI